MKSFFQRHKTGLIPFFIFATVSIIYSLPFLLKWSWIGVGDWELFATMAAIPRTTILHFHQFPFWNPYLGGGNILFTHPEVGILSPFFPLILIFGSIAGLKLQMLLSYFLGFYGLYFLARRLGISNISAYLVSLATFGSSYFALHFAIGHVPFTHFCFLPWFIWFILKSEDNRHYVWGAVISIALIILGNGAAVPLVYTALFSGIFFLIYAVEKKKYLFIRSYIFSLIFGVMLSAVKFLPMLIYLNQNKWEGMARDVTPLKFILPSFFSFDQALFRTVKTAEHWGWHEYSAYIFPLVFVLAIVGLYFSFKKGKIWLLLGLLFFALGLGYFSGLSPWGLLAGLPGFSSLRSPARAFQFVILAVAFLSGLGLDAFIKKPIIRFRYKEKVAVIFIIIVLAVNFGVSLPALQTISHKKSDRTFTPNEFRHEIGDKFNIYDSFLHNRGSLMAPWLSAYKESRGIVSANNQVLMEYISSGQIQIINRQYTPNRVEYAVSSATAGEIIFGIGYDPGWQSTDNRLLYEINGLVATRFRPGESSIILYYRPPYFYTGLLITLISLSGLVLLFTNRNLRKWFETVL